MRIVPESIGKKHNFTYYHDGDGHEVQVIDILVGYYVDEVGIVLMFQSTVPRNTYGQAAETFGGFVVNPGATLTYVPDVVPVQVEKEEDE